MGAQMRVSDKKPYHKPLLAIYGSVQQLTQSNSSSTTGDNAQTSNHKRTGPRIDPGTSPKKTRG
jgi:hypothetical protein